MAYDINEIIQRRIQPEIQETVFKKPYENLKALATTKPKLSGDRYTGAVEVSRTSPARAFTKADVDPESASGTIVKPYWNRTFDHTAAEVFGIDLSNNTAGDVAVDALSREIRLESESLRDIVYSKFWTQIGEDVDSSGTAYSDKSLSRTTYPTLASYEEATDATITLAYARGMIQNVRLNKKCGPLSGYICFVEGTVYWKWQALAAALHTWTKANDPTAVKMGWPDMANFEGLNIMHPDMFPGMTTGDVFMIRKQDIILDEHMPLKMQRVESGRFSEKVVIRYGADCHIDYPGFQGKMTSKD